jgi:hypothetical protein
MVMSIDLLNSRINTFVDRSSKSHGILAMSTFCFAVFALCINLYTHATDCGVEDNLCNAVKNLRAIFQTRLEHSQNVENAREHHKTVRESNHSVIAWITSDVVLVLEVNAR